MTRIKKRIGEGHLIPSVKDAFDFLQANHEINDRDDAV
jgi:hypothetical protein